MTIRQLRDRTGPRVAVMKYSLLLVLVACARWASGFAVGAPVRLRTPQLSRTQQLAACTPADGGKAQVKEAEVVSLVEDDEWLGLAMEMAIVTRVAVRESLKKNVRDFTGKEEYKIGDISKEADARVKEAVAQMRGKEEYELGDLSIALDAIAKDEVCKLTGKDEYEFGDLSVELDKRVKSAVAIYCGKDTYTPGDLSKEVARRVKSGVAEFTGKDGYEFGDVSREIERRREKWVVDYLGTDEYQFGDISKKLGQMFFGNKKKK